MFDKQRKRSIAINGVSVLTSHCIHVRTQASLQSVRNVVVYTTLSCDGTQESGNDLKPVSVPRSEKRDIPTDIRSNANIPVLLLKVLKVSSCISTPRFLLRTKHDKSRKNKPYLVISINHKERRITVTIIITLSTAYP